MKKSLKELLDRVEDVKIYGDKSVVVNGICDDSRTVRKGNLYVAIKGDTVDAHKFIDDVIKKGAVAVVGGSKSKKKWLNKITYVKVNNSRKAIALIASNWFDNPSKKLRIIGVTGTDGKTTTASIIYHILKESKKKTGLISTVSARIGNDEYDTGFHVTNPEPIALHKFLRKMVDKGMEYVVLEVTSHGLHQGRVEGIEFGIGVLTNITHEHLDYHKTWKEYFNSKVKLFMMAESAVILNKDDSSFDKILTIVKKSSKVVSYSIKDKKANFFARSINSPKGKTDFKLTFKGSTLKGETTLIGEYNLQNTLAAIAAVSEVGVSLRKVVEALKTYKPPIGRLEKIKNSKSVDIYVDFAHTPNSLENVLKLLRKQTKGKLIVVFGCAGERDVEKRKLMPSISVKHADISVFTAEDPRSEDVRRILGVMEKSATEVGGIKMDKKRISGLVHGNNTKYFLTISDRGEAISFAINKLAKKGDTVAILGKGHEESMAYKGVEYLWSDHKAVRMALKGKVKEIN